MPKITKRIVDAAAPDPSRDVFVWDDELRGFGLRVFPSGAKAYVLQYRTGGRGSQARRRVIGKHGVLTPDQARDRARRMLAEIADGVDPAAERDRGRDALSIAALADLYIAEGPAAAPNKRAISWTRDRTCIERHIKPLLGRRRALTLTQAEVAKFQIDVAAGKTRLDEKTGSRGRSIVKGGPAAAARSLAVLSAVLKFAANRKLVPMNVAAGVPTLKPGAPRERFLSEREVARLADAIAAMQAEAELPNVATAAIRLLMLTGCRKSEILSARWSQIDFEGGYLRLPTSKTGARTMVLPAPALALLAELPRRGDYVLPAGRKRPGHYEGLQKHWERVRARAGLDDVRIHDLRHSFASFAVAGGQSLFITGKLLGHRQARSTAIYSHLGDDPLRAAADATAARIAAAMTSNRRGAEPVPFVPRTAKR
jgi:integrase